MSDKITDAKLADRLGVLCDFVQDSTQCFNPWSDEALKAVRELISDLKLGNRPRSVFANAVNFQTPRFLNRDSLSHETRKIIKERLDLALRNLTLQGIIH